MSIKEWIFGKEERLGIIESGKGLVATGFASESDSDKKEDSLFEQYRNAYNNYPLVSSAIKVKCDHIVQPFYYTGPNKDELAEWSDIINLDIWFWRLTEQVLVYPLAVVELIKEKKSDPTYSELKFLDPRYIQLERDSTGTLVAVMQEIGNKKLIWGKPIKFQGDIVGKIEDIALFSLYKLSSEKFGTSIIHPVLPILKIKDQIEQDLPEIVKRYAAPIIWASIGDETHPPTQGDISSVKEKLQDIYKDTEFAASYLVKPEVMGFQGRTLNTQPIQEHIDKQVIAGLMTPPVLLGMASGERATAEVQLRSFGRHCKSIQRTLKTQFEDQVINRMFPPAETNTVQESDDVKSETTQEKLNKLNWSDIEERERTTYFETITSLATSGIITKQKANDLLPPQFHETLPLDSPDVSELPPQNFPSTKENPTDPTKTTQGTSRMDKTARKVPMDDKGAKKKPQTNDKVK